MAPFIITGVPGGQPAGQPPPPRLEINDFVQNQKFFSLYIQALQIMYAQPQGDLLSFFQLSGIHGLPFVTWNQSPIEGAGYCVHGTDLFPTWHRPYVAVFEQVIQQHAVDIASKYTTPDAADWKQAAADLRQPFWDWASNIIPPDEVIALAKVTIITANGASTSVDNPFLRYRFHPIEPTFPPPFINWPTTLRYPTSSGSNAQSNVNQLKRRLAAAQQQTTQDTNRLFSIDTWPLFSNHTADEGGTASSLESIHDSIHVLVGGNGHMSSVPVAAFDPIFFLHHCQVDRLLALWSNVHPDTWVPDNEVNQDLTPFWNAPTTFWASSNLQDFGGALNYTYPDFLAPGGADANVSLAAFSGGPATQALFARPPAPAPPAHVAPAPAAPTHAAPTHAASAHAAPAAVPHWTARIRFNQHELGGSFSVLLFLVDVPNDPEEYYTSPNYVGSFHAFVNNASENCANCRNQAGHPIEGYVQINDAIVKHAHEDSLDSAVVVPFLTKNLHWRVLKLDGTVADLPSLEVVVLSAPLTLPPGAKFPVVGAPRHFHGITHGRSGGARHA